MHTITNKLCCKIQYIGCDDATLDLFESQYPLPNGMCYNSYLLLGERVAVMDSVDKRKTAEWIQKIEQTGYTPDYLIIQHTEPDHSGSIGAFLEKYPHATIVASRAALLSFTKLSIAVIAQLHTFVSSLSIVVSKSAT